MNKKNAINYSMILTFLMLSNMCLPVTSISQNFLTPVGTISYKKTLGISDDTMFTIYTTILGSLLVAKIGYDMSWHNTYAQKAHGWYAALKNCMYTQSVTSVQDEALQNLFSPVDRDEMVLFYLWINNSYNSWLCPWNWKDSQKKALKKIQIVTIATLYSDLIALGDQVSGQEVVQFFRRQFSTVNLYPLVFAYELMNEHLICIKSCTKDNVFDSLMQEMVEYLQTFQVLLREEKDYVEEQQTKRMHDLQQEMIRAQYLRNR